MTALRTGIVVALGLLAISPTARAQINNLPPGFGSNNFDPFSAYYGYYIPRNQTIAAQRAGGATETINLHAQARQAEALASTRAGALYNLDNPYELVPLEDRNFTRAPTILVPGQRAGPGPSSFYGRPHGSFNMGRSGGGGASSRAGAIPSGGFGTPRNLRSGVGNFGNIGNPGNFGGMGNLGAAGRVGGRGGFGGFGGFGGGFR